VRSSTVGCLAQREWLLLSQGMSAPTIAHRTSSRPVTRVSRFASPLRKERGLRLGVFNYRQSLKGRKTLNLPPLPCAGRGDPCVCNASILPADIFTTHGLYATITAQCPSQ